MECARAVLTEPTTAGERMVVRRRWTLQMARSEPAPEQTPTSLGAFYVWRRGWPLPPITTSLDRPLVIESTALGAPDGQPGVERAPPPGPLGDIPADEVAGRLAAGHALFTARVDDDLAAYGWSASERAHIGGLDLHFAIPPNERYLWDFVTLPAYRGLGIYPLLLQAILRRQADVADGFWIGHEPTNDASRRGILKAGFRVAGHVWSLADGTLAVVGASEVETEVARRGSTLLGLPFLAAPPLGPPRST